jgi:sortase A
LAIALIVVGAVLIAIPLIQELYHYPWKQTALAADMPDPPLPNIPYISFEEYLRSDPAQLAIPVRSDFTDSENGENETATTDEETPPFVLLGTVKIPRMDISENLFEGTYEQMNYGIGHLAGSPLPGGAGNAVLGAHRVSAGGRFPFRHLDLLENGDTVTVILGEQVFVYEVYDSFIVNIRDIWVLEAVEGESHVLTLLSCEPVVSATRRQSRLIVRARLVSSEFI